MEINKLNITDFPGCEPNAEVYIMDNCLVMVGRTDQTGWHLTVSRTDQFPDFIQVANAIRELVPADIDMAIIPPFPEQEEVGAFFISCWQVDVHASFPRVFIRPPGNEIL